MADTDKIQFTTSTDDADWFREGAKAAGISQPAFFKQLREAVESAALAEEHPEHASTIRTFDDLAARMRELLSATVIAADTATETAKAAEAEERERMAAEIETLRARMAEVEEDRDTKVMAAEAARDASDAKALEEIARANKAAEDAALVRERAARVDECERKLDEARTAADDAKAKMYEARDAEREARDELAKATSELATTKALLERAEDEVATLRQLLMPRGADEDKQA